MILTAKKFKFFAPARVTSQPAQPTLHHILVCRFFGKSSSTSSKKASCLSYANLGPGGVLCPSKAVMSCWSSNHSKHGAKDRRAYPQWACFGVWTPAAPSERPTSVQCCHTSQALCVKFIIEKSSNHSKHGAWSERKACLASVGLLWTAPSERPTPVQRCHTSQALCVKKNRQTTANMERKIGVFILALDPSCA